MFLNFFFNFVFVSFRKVVIPIALQDILPHHEIKRRPTGFISADGLSKFLMSRGQAVDEDDDDDDEEQTEMELESEVIMKSSKKATPVVIRGSVTIESEKIEIAKNPPKKDAMLIESIVKKKSAMFRDEDDDSRYRLKNIVL